MALLIPVCSGISELSVSWDGERMNILPLLCVCVFCSTFLVPFSCLPKGEGR